MLPRLHHTLCLTAIVGTLQSASMDLHWILYPGFPDRIVTLHACACVYALTCCAVPQLQACQMWSRCWPACMPMDSC